MFEMDFEDCLNKASRGERDSLKDFYNLLWDLNVIIPVVPDFYVKAFGFNPKSKDVFAITNVDNKLILPIFSKKEIFMNWATKEVLNVVKPFKTFIWLLPENVWVHLNPNQDIGKEFSPWEIEILKKSGLKAIDEIIDEVTPNYETEYELEKNPSFYDNYKKKLRTVFEVYEEIEEAFLITLKNIDRDFNSVIIGFKQKKLNSLKMKSLTLEIKEMARVVVKDNVEIQVVYDINDSRSHYSFLFNDVVPFYIKTKSFPSKTSIFNKIFGFK